MSEQQIFLKFVKSVRELVKYGLITKEMIIHYDKANRGNLHSKLQSGFMTGVESLNYLAIPEEKIRLQDPIKSKYLRRKQWQYRTDVAIYKQGTKREM